jgi:hypothetical protein
VGSETGTETVPSDTSLALVNATCRARPGIQPGLCEAMAGGQRYLLSVMAPLTACTHERRPRRRLAKLPFEREAAFDGWQCPVNLLGNCGAF